MSKAPGRWGARGGHIAEKTPKGKKALTKGGGYGILTAPVRVGVGENPVLPHPKQKSAKKLEKVLENPLTRAAESGIITRLTRKGQANPSKREHPMFFRSVRAH